MQPDTTALAPRTIGPGKAEAGAPDATSQGSGRAHAGGPELGFLDALLEASRLQPLAAEAPNAASLLGAASAALASRTDLAARLLPGEPGGLAGATGPSPPDDVARALASGSRTTGGSEPTPGASLPAIEASPNGSETERAADLLRGLRERALQPSDSERTGSAPRGERGAASVEPDASRTPDGSRTSPVDEPGARALQELGAEQRTAADRISRAAELASSARESAARHSVSDPRALQVGVPDPREPAPESPAQDGRGADTPSDPGGSRAADARTAGGGFAHTLAETLPEGARLELRPPTGAEARAAARALPELPAANEHEIVRQAQILTRRDGGEARIQLQPPQLGELELRISLRGGQVTVDFLAERGAVAELLARHASELRHAFESQGVPVERIHVDVRDDERAPDARRPGEREGEAAGRERGRRGDEPPTERETERRFYTDAAPPDAVEIWI